MAEISGLKVNEVGLSNNPLGAFGSAVERGIRLAIEQAKLSREPYFKVGACLIQKKSVLGKGFNSRKTSPSSTARYRGIHAEHASVANFAGFRDKTCNLKNAVMFVARVTRTGALAMSKPCPCCQVFLGILGIKKVFFTNSNGTIGTMSL